MYDWAKLCEMLAAQEPLWESDTQSGYHALTFAHLVGELVRRIDGRPIDEFVREEITGPLKADMLIGVQPEDDRRVADLCTTPHALPPQNPSQVRSEQEAEGAETASGDGSASESGDSAPQVSELVLRALGNPFVGPKVANSDAWRRGVFPSANGHGNARGIAAMYGTIASGGAFGATRLFSSEAHRTDARGTAHRQGSGHQRGRRRDDLGHGLHGEQAEVVRHQPSRLPSRRLRRFARFLRSRGWHRLRLCDECHECLNPRSRHALCRASASRLSVPGLKQDEPAWSRTQQ